MATKKNRSSSDGPTRHRRNDEELLADAMAQLEALRDRKTIGRTIVKLY